MTVCSLVESEIYATNECVKALLRIQHIIGDVAVKHMYIPSSNHIKIYNDNNSCICWSKSTTAKGLRHMTTRENSTIESVQDKTASIHHISGAVNLADVLTKEIKNIKHLLAISDIITRIIPPIINPPPPRSLEDRGNCTIHVQTVQISSRPLNKYR